METSTNKKVVDKSKVDRIRFSKEEVLNSSKQQIERLYYLRRSLTLGNLYKQHVKLSFLDEIGRELTTVATVWALTEQYVILKGGRLIPISSIKTVELF